ncbi:uncharacterized protein LOC131213398 [Anopheles bellator]|uniref:uncharacterized protein LOC131213398 n=1 Tax=Anopheles bellator TaxID=139047 RepID=UPI0026496788|nr:uncharacterized protein LOC131213398 [Anopheles bellator]
MHAMFRGPVNAIEPFDSFCRSAYQVTRWPNEAAAGKLLPERVQEPEAFRNPGSEPAPVSTLTPERQDLLNALARFAYFDRWSEEQRRACCNLAHIRQFRTGQQVFVEGQATVNYAHFVLSGECGLLQCLRLLRRNDRRTGTVRYRLAKGRPIDDEITRFHRRRAAQGDGRSNAAAPPAPDSDDLRFPAVPSGTTDEFHFIDIASYSCGSVFGIGEQMLDRVVFARSRVHCLLIPRYWLLEKPQNRGNIWNRIRIFLEQRQPSRERLFRRFVTGLVWHRYRSQLVDDFVAMHEPRHVPRLIDVPLVCRIEECDVAVYGTARKHQRRVTS